MRPPLERKNAALLEADRPAPALPHHLVWTAPTRRSLQARPWNRSVARGARAATLRPGDGRSVAARTGEASSHPPVGPRRPAEPTGDPPRTRVVRRIGETTRTTNL